jgi:hypothetical protein
MPRNRIIKVEFWADAKVGKLTPTARLLYIGMWNFSDDYGTVPANAKKFNADIFEFDDFSKEDIESMLQEIESQGMIQKFEADEKEYYYITHFLDHQKISKKSERVYPLPPDSILKKCSENVTVTLQKRYDNVPKENSNGNEKEKKNDNGLADEPPSIEFSFEAFKQQYPTAKDGNKPGMTRAQKIYSQSVNGKRSEIFKALENYAKSEQAENGIVMSAEKFLLTDWNDWFDIKSNGTAKKKPLEFA